MPRIQDGYFQEDGTLCNGFQEGKGKYVYENGDVYVGEFLNNNFQGFGTLIMRKYKYIGYFNKGKLHGKGILTNEDGYKVFGIWEYDRFKEKLETEPEF